MRASFLACGLIAATALAAAACNSSGGAPAATAPAASTLPIVAVAPVVRKSLARTIDISAELVPYQETDVYAKESGYVSQLLVDYGSHVKAGQVMAVLEIPELEAQLKEDEAQLDADDSQIARVSQLVSAYKAQDTALHLEYERLHDVSTQQPGLVAEQEVDDAEAKDLAAVAQVSATQAQLDAATHQLAVDKAKLVHDQALYSYARITAPFDGVVTQRYANLGALMQAGTSSSTQAMPLVRVSEDDRFRLVIPVPETYATSIHPGDPVTVRVSSLNRTFRGTVVRTSDEVRSDTRTLHTEVDVLNPDHVLMAGLYAEADLTVQQVPNVLTVPVEAVDMSSSGSTGAVDVVGAGGVVEPRTVTLGLQTANSDEVLGGLQAGERVVVGDRSGLRAGERVRAQLVALPSVAAAQNNPPSPPPE